MSTLVGLLSAAATTWLVLLLLMRWSPRLGFIDRPNERSMHALATPRCGGLALAAGVSVGVLILRPPGPLQAPIPVLALLVLLGVSAWDDRGHVNPVLRLLVHVAVGVAVVGSGYRISGPWWPGVNLDVPYGVLLFASVLFLIWMINLYNFMDGLDGFAGGMAVIGFSALAVLGRDIPGFTQCGLLVATCALVFVGFNFPPARVFLGDAGSATLGWCAGLMAFWGASKGVVPLWLSVLVFSPFIVDATVTLISRLVKGCKPWQAHREHAYQRLILNGWSRRRTVVSAYFLMAACAATALWAQHREPVVQGALLIGWIAVYAGILIGVNVHERQGLSG